MTRPHLRPLVVLAILALIAPALTPTPAVAQSGAIKIGMLAPLTGPFAQIGKDLVNGAARWTTATRCSPGSGG